MDEFLIGGKFRLGRQIGSGDVYIGTNVQSGEEVAIKIEGIRSKQPQLLYESKLYKFLAGAVGIPTVHWYGVVGDSSVMVMDFVGPLLEDLFSSCNYQAEHSGGRGVADKERSAGAPPVVGKGGHEANAAEARPNEQEQANVRAAVRRLEAEKRVDTTFTLRAEADVERAAAQKARQEVEASRHEMRLMEETAARLKVAFETMQTATRLQEATAARLKAEAEAETAVAMRAKRDAEASRAELRAHAGALFRLRSEEAERAAAQQAKQEEEAFARVAKRRRLGLEVAGSVAVQLAGLVVSDQLFAGLVAVQAGLVFAGLLRGPGCAVVAEVRDPSAVVAEEVAALRPRRLLPAELGMAEPAPPPG